MSIELPPPPANVEDAMRQANAMAYGFAKHTDVAYWLKDVGYYGDPLYYWKRMLGWQLPASSPDRALYGLYAFPPSPWHTDAPAPTPTPTPDPTPVDPDVPEFDLIAFLARLNELEATIAELKTLLQGTIARPWPVYSGKIPLLGTVTLTPKG